ncbi:MAG: ORF6N domain-containing protein [Campylobacterales bacterium]|nr:ORF6N domain-containing protein [Campylobacterales bacterium]
MGNLLTAKDNIQTKIHNIRGVDVMLDSDIAQLYGVETREVNQAVKNNPNKFPNDFLFTLTQDEWDPLRSKNLTLNEKKGRGQHRKYAPLAFTEQGVYMLATVLKGDTAAEITIAIMRTFTKMRHYLLEHADLAKQIQEIKQEISENKKWTKDRLSATADAITILEDMILDVKAATEVESIGFLRSIK